MQEGATWVEFNVRIDVTRGETREGGRNQAMEGLKVTQRSLVFILQIAESWKVSKQQRNKISHTLKAPLNHGNFALGDTSAGH